MCASWRRFNINLALALFLTLVLGVASGCKSSEEKKKSEEATSLRLYLETEFDTTGEKTTLVPVYRASPVLVRVNREPFLDEGHITDAAVVETVGGFAIQVKYDFRGTLVLESVTSTYRNQRMAIYCNFTEGRWLAAPRMATRVKDGVIAFTPDATREEAERIVRGLNNIATKLGNRPKGTKKAADQKKL